jgi:hypothetical protein
MRDVEQKRLTTKYLHLGPQLVESVDLGWNHGAHT